MMKMTESRNSKCLHSTLKRTRFAVLILGGAMLTGCISASSIDVPTQEPAVIEDRAVVDGEALPLPDEPRLNVETLDDNRAISPVVSRLLASAQQLKRAKDWDGASGALERALRIEPRNASLWASLAEIKFEQKEWKGALQLAAKSNALSGGDATLRRRNWYLMANAHEALGDFASAQRFRDKLN
ncbi:tetratricopeptide repeat protein [Arenicella sp. 4NH20-0111]|uniref:tetratricopeptide repeat protein n=1 Tax=Arenicella sp. 4NH20-0111 TaxID=3127648 RepID=UPI00333FD6D4